MKKNAVFLLSLLVVLSGCVKDKNKKPQKMSGQKTEGAQGIDIPLASNEAKSYFDDKDDLNLGEFVLVEDAEVAQNPQKAEGNIETAQGNVDTTGDSVQMQQAGNTINLDEKDLEDFSWVQEVEHADETFKKCHFEFDKYDVKEDQEKKIEENIKLAKKMVDEGANPTIVIDGHSCHSCGSQTYNLVLSEKRAKAIADRFVAAGIPSDSIKIVPRGSEVPEKDEFGSDITGSKYDQWPNRRSEVRVVYS
ncbi:OmpA family protein [Candidatus Dependentiae bacterium]